MTGDLTVQNVDGFDVDGSVVELEYEPAISGKLGFEMPVYGKLNLGAEARYVGEQKCENPEIGGLQTLGSSKSFDFKIRRVFDVSRAGILSRLDASASVKNVTDSAIYDQCGLPQPGRLIQVQFRIR